MIEPLYGDFDGMPSRYNVREAWVYHRDKNAWVEIDLIAHRKGSYEVGKVDFDFFFPNTPPLPPEAFARPVTEPYYGGWHWSATRWNEREAWIFNRTRNAWGRINLISHEGGSTN